MQNKEALTAIANHYGYEAQSGQCIEEMAELTQAFNKFRRANKGGQPTNKSVKECLDDLAEEIADVQIMIWQIEILLKNADAVNKNVEKKIERTLRRMRDE